jgi:hypothetical protein
VRDALSGMHTRRLSSDGTPLPRKETPRSAQTIVFGAATAEEATAARAAARAAVLKTPLHARKVPARSTRRVWPWVLGVLAVVAIAGSTMWRQSREAQALRYAQAQRDSAHRADSVRKVDSARTDSVNSAALVGGMVDSSKLAEQSRKDSLAKIATALREGVVSAIRNYTNAIQRGDVAAARAAFPRVPEAELTNWQKQRERYDLRMRVELAPPRQVVLSDRDLVADTDVDLVVQYVDRTTRDVVSTNRLPRHATLTKQRQRWQLDVLKPR